MKTTIENLPQSRTRVVIEPTALEVTEAFEQALAVISSGIKVTGFRSGKAPAEMVRAQIDSEKLRDEASTIIVRRAWQQAVTELKELPIQDPEVTIETFEEAKDAKLVFEFDIRPAIKLGDWQKIKVKKEKTPEVPAGELDEDLHRSQGSHRS
jgi:trigger factor